MRQINEDTVFNGIVLFNVLPEPASDILIDSVTPNINNLTLVRGSGFVVTITNFFGGVDSHRLRIIGDGTTTIKHGTNIFTNTGADKLLLLNKVYTFNYFQATSKWYENE